MSRAAVERPEAVRILALPDAGHGSGVLALACSAREVDLLEESCTRLARHGFVALGVVASDPSAGEAAAQPSAAERRCVDDALDALFRHDATDGARIGLVGFGRGAALASDAAARSGRVAALVAFGGAAGIAALDESEEAASAGVPPRLVLLGEKDPDAAPDALAALEARHGGDPAFELRILPGVEREFFDPSSADRYDAGAARAGWDAALARLLAEL